MPFKLQSKTRLGLPTATQYACPMSRRFHSAVGKLGIQSIKENEFQSYSFLKLLGVLVTVGIFIRSFIRSFVRSCGHFQVDKLGVVVEQRRTGARNIPQISSRVDKIRREKEKAASYGTLQR